MRSIIIIVSSRKRSEIMKMALTRQRARPEVIWHVPSDLLPESRRSLMPVFEGHSWRVGTWRIWRSEVYVRTVECTRHVDGERQVHLKANISDFVERLERGHRGRKKRKKEWAYTPRVAPNKSLKFSVMLLV